jgi:hypothetical protein
MPALQASGIGDLIAATTRDFGEPNFTEIATDLQEHPIAEALMGNMEDMKKFGSGTGLQWNVMVGHNNSAVNSGLYATVRPNQIDTMIQAQVDWRYSRFHYAIERREVAMNRTPRRIIDLIQERRIAALISFAELLENNFWRFPAATDTETPLGLPYWVGKSATAGYNTTLPTGYTTVGNIIPANYPRWAPYAFPFTNISDDDWLASLRLAMDQTNWKPPVGGIPSTVKGSKRRLFSNITVKQQAENLAKTQNENIGPDLAKYDGGVMVRKTPLEYVPFLNADSTNPTYGLHMGSFQVGYMAGEWMKQVVIPQLDSQPTVALTVWDCMYNFFTYNRRLCFVGSNGTTTL